jgi:DNA polymerase-3 subunit gamma/tau
VLREEGVQFEEEALAMISRAADGGLRDALSLTDQVLSIGNESIVTSERVREALGLIPDEEYLALLDIVIERRAADVFPAVQRLADEGVDFALMLAGLGDLLRDQLAISLGGTASDLPERMRAALTERKNAATPQDLLRMLHALLELEPLFRRSGQPQLLVESLLVRFALLDRTVDIEEVLRGFGDGGREDPPNRRVTTSESRGASAHALPPTPPAAVAPAIPNPVPAPPIPRPATERVAQAAAEQQRYDASHPPEHHANIPVEPAVPAPPPSIERVRAEWPRVIESVKSGGRGMLAQAVTRLTPADVSASGAIVLGYSSEDDTFARAVEKGRADVLAALQGSFEGVTTFTLRAIGTTSTERKSPQKRLTAQDVKKERLDQLSSRDPLLDAAVRALDLELLD